MAFLVPDETRTDITVPVKVRLIPDDARSNRKIASWVPAGGKMKPCYPLLCGGIGVTVHNTQSIHQAQGTTMAEQYSRATWPNCNMGGVVVHYYVDDKEAWQNLREDEQGWHAADKLGPGNTQTIAVEIIMSGKGDKADIDAEENGAMLVASILHRHCWGIDDVYQHHDWYPPKNCPLYIRPHWPQFLEKVKAYLDSLNGETPATDENEALRKEIDRYEAERDKIKKLADEAVAKLNDILDLLK